MNAQSTALNLRIFPFVFMLVSTLTVCTITQTYAQFSFVEVIRNSDEDIEGMSDPSHVAVTPDDQYVYVAGNGDHAIVIYERNMNTGMLSFVDAVMDGENGIEDLGGVREMAISADGKYLYAIAYVDQAISTFSRNEDGTLKFVQVLKDGENGTEGLGGAYALALSPDGNNIYVAANADHALSVFTVDNVSGMLSFEQLIVDNGAIGSTADFKLRSANSVVVSPDNQHVYVTGFDDDGVSVFERDTNNQGRLTNIQNIDNWALVGIWGNVKPTDIVISENGATVYVSGYGGTSAGNLTVFSRNLDTGMLNKQQAFADDASADNVNFTLLSSLGRLTSVTLTPANDFVLTTGDESPDDSGPDFMVNSFERNASTGLLDAYLGFREGGSGVVEGLTLPNALAFSQDGNSFYVVSGQEDAISVYSFLFPIITEISPQSGYPTTKVTINGEDFGNEQNGSTIKFGEVSITEIDSWTDSLIVLTLPEMEAGEVDVSLTVNNYTATSEGFIAEELPSVFSISDFSPSQGKSGLEVSIRGAKFGDGSSTPKVLFGTIEATEVSWISSEQIKAAVPAMEEGAVSLKVIVGSDTAISNTDFVVDNTPPSASIQLSDADGKVKKGQTLVINATFDEPVANTPVMQIGLKFPEDDALFDMTKVSDTEYQYEYVVGEGDMTVELFLSQGTDLSTNPVDSSPLASFVIDNTPPHAEFSPEDKAVAVSTSSEITIQFDKAVRLKDGNALDETALAQTIEFVELKYGENEAVPFTGNYNTENFRIILQPEALENNETYQLKIKGNVLEDEADNPVNEMQVLFKTGADQYLQITPNDFFIQENNEGKTLLKVSDANFIKKAEVFVRGITDTEEWSGPIDLMSMERILSDNTFFYPFEAISDPIGIEYYYLFEDKFARSYADTLYLYQEYEDGLEQSVIPGKNRDDYQIISFPISLDKNAVSQVFDELGTYDKDKWRLFTLERNNKFIEFGDFQSIMPGHAYLLIFTHDSLTTLGSGKGWAVEVHKEKAFEIQVHEGWNLIGNPYPFDVSWKKVSEHPDNASAKLSDQLISYSPNWNDTTDILRQGGGGLLYIEEGISKIKIPLSSRLTDDGRRQALHKNKGGWQLTFKLSQVQGALKRTISGFGMHPDASFSYDQYDMMTPPSFRDYLNINFSHPEYLLTHFTKDIVPLQDHYIWAFEISTNLDGTPLNLSWSKDDLPEGEQQLFLFDEGINQFVDMRKKQNYSLIGHKNSAFKILYGNEHFMDEYLEAKAVSLNLAYPNPFSTTTHIPFSIPKAEAKHHVEINIYDTSGKKLCTLLDKVLEHGFYETKWDGKDNAGQQVNNGMYICELVADDGKQLIRKKKRILLLHP